MKWMQLKARPLQLLRTRQRVTWGDTNYLQYKFYFTLSFNCLNDLIELISTLWSENSRYVFYRLFSLGYGQYSLFLLRLLFCKCGCCKEDGGKEIHCSRFARLRRFTVFAYNRNLWDFPCMPLQHDLHGLTLTRRVIRNWKMAPMDGGHVIIKRKKWCWLFLQPCVGSSYRHTGLKEAKKIIRIA